MRQPRQQSTVLARVAKRHGIATTCEVADYLGVPYEHIAHRRALGLGAAPFKIDGSPGYFYQLEDTPEWRALWFEGGSMKDDASAPVERCDTCKFFAAGKTREDYSGLCRRRSPSKDGALEALLRSYDEINKLRREAGEKLLEGEGALAGLHEVIGDAAALNSIGVASFPPVWFDEWCGEYRQNPFSAPTE